MEILQIIIRAAAAGLLGQHLVRAVALAALGDLGKVAEEQPRAVEQRQQRAVVIRRQRIDAGLDIGEILLEQRRPVGLDALIDAGTDFGFGGAPSRRCTSSASRRMT